MSNWGVQNSPKAFRKSTIASWWYDLAGRGIKVQLLPMQIRTPGWLKKFRSVSAKWTCWPFKIGTHQCWAGPRCFLAVRQNPLHEMSLTQNNKCAHYQAEKKMLDLACQIGRLAFGINAPREGATRQTRQPPTRVRQTGCQIDHLIHGQL